MRNKREASQGGELTEESSLTKQHGESMTLATRNVDERGLEHLTSSHASPQPINFIDYASKRKKETVFKKLASTLHSENSPQLSTQREVQPAPSLENALPPTSVERFVSTAPKVAIHNRPRIRNVAGVTHRTKKIKGAISATQIRQRPQVSSRVGQATQFKLLSYDAAAFAAAALSFIVMSYSIIVYLESVGQENPTPTRSEAVALGAIEKQLGLEDQVSINSAYDTSVDSSPEAVILQQQDELLEARLIELEAKVRELQSSLKAKQ